MLGPLGSGRVLVPAGRAAVHKGGGAAAWPAVHIPNRHKEPPETSGEGRAQEDQRLGGPPPGHGKRCDVYETTSSSRAVKG